MKAHLAVADMYAHGCHLRCHYLIQSYDTVYPASTTAATAADVTSSQKAIEMHYMHTPPVRIEALSSTSVSAMWEKARFPGHFDGGQFYAVAAVSAVCCELAGMLLGRDYCMLQATFSAKRLVPATTPCVLKVERQELPLTLLQSVRAVPDVIAYRATLTEADSTAEPAVTLVLLLA
jgi:hypothetical protein